MILAKRKALSLRPFPILFFLVEDLIQVFAHLFHHFDDRDVAVMAYARESDGVAAAAILL